MKTKPMNAWLIMWEWAGDHAKVEQPYLDILNIRKSVSYVRDYVQRLHEVHCSSLREKADLARYKNPTQPAYEATVQRTVSGTVEIHCGHNPWLLARPVKNLVVETDEDTLDEKLTWESYRDKP